MTIKASPAFSITPEQFEKWKWDVLRFFATLLVLFYLPYVQGKFSDGFAWSDFVPDAFVWGAIANYLAAILVNFLMKWVPAKPEVIVKS